MKLLSLFDGSGGFPLAGAMCGIIPVAASEIEPFPIRVTTKRFPQMKHLGDISKVNGAEIEPVDVITFGSPCQDLSVAGKRKGLNHSELGDEETTRSGLFMEAVRIIKEMKEATNGQYPTFAVWENVPGAYSSNKGEDFRIVLEELEKTASGDTVHIPEPPKGKWLNAGEILGDNYSIAWRTLDAQYWGVPQRRRRIYLVADFRGQRAGKILFEREGLRGNFTQGRAQGQGTAGDAENGIGTADREKPDCIGFDTYNMVPTDDVTVTLRANSEYNYAPVFVKAGKEECYAIDHAITTGGNCTAQGSCVYEDCMATLKASGVHAVAYAVENHPADSRVNIIEDGTCQCLTSRMGTGGGNVPLVMEKPVICLQGNGIDRADTAGCNGRGWNDEVCYTLNTIDRPAVCYSFDSLASNSMKSKNPHSGCRVVDKAKTLDTSTQDPSKNQGGICVVECISLDRAAYNQGINAKFDIGIDDSGTAHTLVAKGPNAVCYWDGEQVCGTLTANNAGGNQRMPDKDNFNCIIQLASGKDVAGCLMASGYEKLGAQEMFSGDYTVIEGFDGYNSTLTGDKESTLGVNCGMSTGRNGVCCGEPHYIVRRLTPLECCRLQGFPDWWCDGLETPEPTEEDLEFWREVFETHRQIVTEANKPKTDKQIIKWLKDPYSDSAIYKMWGNGIALPNALFVMQGIAEELFKENEH